VEGARSGGGEFVTATTATLASGKGHKDENFPVASVLLKAEYRAPVMAFYRFARAADDVADNAKVDADERLAVLAEMRATLAGTSRASPEARALRDTLSERGLSPRHGLDLLTAFERDCRVNRCRDWDDLIDYCRYSAMPVGRYVLDVHGESQDCWPASDNLCAALQVINHLQDCGKDYRAIDRVYVPLNALAEHGAAVGDLGARVATPQLRATIVALAERTDDLLAQSAGFASQIRDRRLSIEVAIIHRLAVSLNNRLKTRDPLSERAHHSKPQALGLAVMAALSQMVGR
jgi:squalene synthase HpnC